MALPVLYTNPQSRGMTAQCMLEEMGIDYELRILNYEGEMKMPEYLAINPMGKVPSLVHGNQIVTETAAICVYLADAFPETELGPRPDERGAYYRWLFFCAGCVEPMISNKSLGLTPTAEQEKQIGYGSEASVTDALEHALQDTPYLCGDRFTAADVYAGMSMAWTLKFRMLEPRRTFLQYVKRLATRPAFAKVMGEFQV